MRTIWLLPVLLFPAALGAQSSTARASTELRATAGGVVLATIREGTPLATGRTANGWTAVTLDGWLHRGMTGAKRDTFALSAGTDGAMLRASADPGAPLLARLERGMGLVRVGEHGAWVHVRRSAWVRSSALAPAAAGAREEANAAPVDTAAASAESAVGAAAEPAPAPGAFAAYRRTMLQSAPDGDTLAVVSPRTRVTTLARQRGWVRVQVEGWIRAADLASVDTTVLTAISAADLRAEPDKFRGETVRWQVQKIAFQTADPLRRGFAPDEPYLLARGPGAESSLLYLALPPSLVEQARGIEPLATMVVTARVRAGRSEPSGVPLLDVVSITQR